MISNRVKLLFLVFFIFFVLSFIFSYSVSNEVPFEKGIEVLGTGTVYFSNEMINLLSPTEEVQAKRTLEAIDIELLVHKKVNEVREGNELEPLEWDAMLAYLARTHSQDMAIQRYFNHTNFFGEGPNERAQRLGIRTIRRESGTVYYGIGENLGLMPKGVVQDLGVILLEEDVAEAMVVEWMESQAHRDNILEPTYRFTGIAVYFDGYGNYYITQNFQ